MEHYHAEDRRIDFGAGQGNKRRGEGALDPATTAELGQALAGRREGPLLLSPKGERLEVSNLLRSYREAFGLGLVAELWPADVPWDVNRAHQVNRALLSGQVPPVSGRPPKDPDKLATRREKAGTGAQVGTA